MDGFREKYGLLWPEAMPDPLIELKVWKHWREPEYAACTEKEPWNCFWRAIYDLVPRKEFVRHEWSENHIFDWTTERFIITWGAASSGKAQPLDSVVYTPTGPRKMGDLQVGDRVIAQDGKTAAVIRTHDVGEQEEFEVEFMDGTKTLCAGTHLWEVGFKDGAGRRNRIVETRWMSEQKRVGRFFVPLCDPVYFEKRASLVPPYLMGALLGDGCFVINGQVRLSATDPDIIEAARGCLKDGYELRPVSPGDFMIVKTTRAHGEANYYLRAIKHYGLDKAKSADKFIPDDYMFAEKCSREELLAGLMDTDGTVGTNGGLSFTSVSERLAKGVQFLVQSLGGVASISSRIPRFRGADGEKKDGQRAYTVFIRLPNNAFLFKSSAKRARLSASAKGLRGRYVVRAARTGRVVPMKCITLDHPRGLYLTNDFIATHNSNDYGLLSLIDWMTDPNETVTILASTSLQMLKLRSYESVLRYFQLVKQYAAGYAMPGKLRKTDGAIILDEDDDAGVATDKASIRGVAVAEGTEQEARSKLAGAHLPYVRLILDELAQMRPAAMRVRTNLAMGAKDFKLVGLCNPDSFTDLAAQFSVPDAPGGFASLDPETSFEWRSKYGKVRRHDGLRSPGILHPERNLTFLLTKSKYEEILADSGGNPDDPEVWTMLRGFPPAQGKRQTLLTMNEVLRSGATEDVVWMGAPSLRVIGCDPAFSEGGNRAVMQALELGMDKNGQLKILCRDPRYAKIDASAKDTVTDQVGQALKDYAEELGVPAGLVGVDDSATQSVADHMQSKHGMVVRRFVSNAKPSDMPISKGEARKASERFHNQSTELWAATAAFVRSGQMRLFPMVAAEQLCSRPMEPNKRPLRLLSKKTSLRDGSEMKSGESPDEQDAMSIAVGVLRFVLNLLAGADSLPDRYAGPWGKRPVDLSGLRRTARRYDLDSRAYGEVSAT